MSCQSEQYTHIRWIAYESRMKKRNNTEKNVSFADEREIFYWNWDCCVNKLCAGGVWVCTGIQTCVCVWDSVCVCIIHCWRHRNDIFCSYKNVVVLIVNIWILLTQRRSCAGVLVGVLCVYQQIGIISDAVCLHIGLFALKTPYKRHSYPFGEMNGVTHNTRTPPQPLTISLSKLFVSLTHSVIASYCNIDWELLFCASNWIHFRRLSECVSQRDHVIWKLWIALTQFGTIHIDSKNTIWVIDRSCSSWMDVHMIRMKQQQGNQMVRRDQRVAFSIGITWNQLNSLVLVVCTSDIYLLLKIILTIWQRSTSYNYITYNHHILISLVRIIYLIELLLQIPRTRIEHWWNWSREENKWTLPHWFLRGFLFLPKNSVQKCRFRWQQLTAKIFFWFLVLNDARNKTKSINILTKNTKFLFFVNIYSVFFDSNFIGFF